jgi:diguanylate cyclase (GGDEF)-like protein
MRPDAVNWSNTNTLSTLEFSPRQLVYRRLTRWALRTSILQAALAVALSIAMPVALWHVMGWLPSGAATAGSSAEPQAPSPTAPRSNMVVVKRARDSSAPVAPAARADENVTAGQPGGGSRFMPWISCALAQVAALLLAQLVLLPMISTTLRAHASGSKELFDAIRSMAAGVVPKPLAAGGPGETGYLAMAFNDMTTRLLASRRALVEANEMLERRVKERTQELQEANEKLERMASTDVLTGLANRRALMQRGQILFQSSIHNDSDLAVFLVDLDHFKAVNDTLGHKKGDELITVAANVLREGCRTDDLTARLGGDEFIVLMPTGSLEAVTAKAEEIQSEFQRQVRLSFSDQALPKLPSMSIGLTSRRQSGAATFAELIQRADLALYRAKDLGRGRAEVYEPRAAA